MLNVRHGFFKTDNTLISLLDFSKKHISYLDKLWDGFCILSIVGIWPRFIEPRLLKKTSLVIPIPHLKKELSGLKIVQFSDLHFSKNISDAFLQKIHESIALEKPDILAFTGDFLCYSKLEDRERLLHFFANLPKASLGNFAVFGNHDYASFVSIGDTGNYSLINEKETGSSISKGLKRLIKPIKPTGVIDPEVTLVKEQDTLREMLSKTPFTLLHNEKKIIDVLGSDIQVVGLGEYSLGKMNESLVFPDREHSDFTLTLLHNPDGAPHLKMHAHLILSGHTHGGQINLPFLRDRFIMMEHEELCTGLIKRKDSWIYVSRGVGSVMPFRWFCPPEIVSLTLERA